MAKESIEAALKRFDERYYKLRLDKVILESFGNNLLSYMKQINFAVKNNETEEHIKNIVNRFLRATFILTPNLRSMHTKEWIVLLCTIIFCMQFWK